MYEIKMEYGYILVHNANSIFSKKFASVIENLDDDAKNCLLMCFIAETYLSTLHPDEEISLNTTHNLYRCDRYNFHEEKAASITSGGALIGFHKELPSAHVFEFHGKNFEAAGAIANVSGTPFVAFGVYVVPLVPPSSYVELFTLILRKLTSFENVIVAIGGDFNLDSIFFSNEENGLKYFINKVNASKLNYSTIIARIFKTVIDYLQLHICNVSPESKSNNLLDILFCDKDLVTEVEIDFTGMHTEKMHKPHLFKLNIGKITSKSNQVLQFYFSCFRNSSLLSNRTVHSMFLSFQIITNLKFAETEKIIAKLSQIVNE